MRATQFFEFIGRIADSGTHDGTVALPPLLFQPEAAGDVATALAGNDRADPPGRSPARDRLTRAPSDTWGKE